MSPDTLTAVGADERRGVVLRAAVYARLGRRARDRGRSADRELIRGLQVEGQKQRAEQNLIRYGAVHIPSRMSLYTIILYHNYNIIAKIVICQARVRGIKNHPEGRLNNCLVGVVRSKWSIIQHELIEVSRIVEGAKQVSREHDTRQRLSLWLIIIKKVSVLA